MHDKDASGVLRLARKVGAVAGLVALAAAALLSGTDRQSRDFPTSPSFVGWPYDTGAARARAALAFVRVGPASAIGYARRAIVSDPISAPAVSLLGRAELYSQHLTKAREAFQVSGQLGWRDSLTQIYWLDQAMQSDNLKVAAERLDALLRQSPHDENAARFLAVVAASPEGRAALAQRLRAAPVWSEAFVTDLTDLPPDQLEQRIDVMARTGSRVWNCEVIAPMTQKLIDLKMFSQAMSVWRGSCSSSTALVYDGGFDKLDTTKSIGAFEWQLSSRGDVEVQPAVDDTGNKRIGFEVTATRSLQILRQLIVLEPGAYRLSWHTPDTPPTASRQLAVALTCNPDLSGAATGIPQQGSKDIYYQDFTVDRTCAAPLLTFWLSPRAHVYLDDITLQRK